MVGVNVAAGVLVGVAVGNGVEVIRVGFNVDVGGPAVNVAVGLGVVVGVAVGVLVTVGIAVGV